MRVDTMMIIEGEDFVRSDSYDKVVLVGMAAHCA